MSNAETELNIFINVTTKTELNTIYKSDIDDTYESLKFTERTKIQDFIRKLMRSNWFRNNFKTLKLSFWGGESTQHPKAIEHFLNKYKDDDRINFKVYTSLYRLSPIKELFDITNKIQIEIMYDGDTLMDCFRSTEDIPIPSYKIEKNIDWLIENNIYFDIKPILKLDKLKFLHHCYLDLRKYNKQFKPNLDCFNDYNIVESDWLKIKEELEVALEQIVQWEAYNYRKYGTSNFSWFTLDKTNAVNRNTFMINYDCNVYRDVYSYYSSNKLEFLIGTIENENIYELLEDQWKTSLDSDYGDVTCIECNPSYCYINEVKTYDSNNSLNETKRFRNHSENKYFHELSLIISQVKDKFLKFVGEETEE